MHGIYFKGCLNFLLHLFHPNNAFAALFFRYFRSEQKKILQFMCKVHNHVWSIIMVCLHWTTTTTTSQNKNKQGKKKKTSIDSFSCTSSILSMTKLLENSVAQLTEYRFLPKCLFWSNSFLIGLEYEKSCSPVNLIF